MRREQTKNLVFSALFMALGMVLPFLFGQLKEIGDSLLPLHLVAMLTGLICGWQYGLVLGISLPFLRSLVFTMPPLYPNAIWMALEFATYGALLGFLYSRRKKYSRAYLLLCLVISMLAGRVVWGISKALLLGLADKPFGVEAFVVGGFLDALPGIILQFIVIPLVMEFVAGRLSNKKGVDR